mmetsp:Transcript_73648/g.193219  ORF Transcript_73648/g.193219 Transcript_73648/m.193219 type:complete len:904 (+) Transcript_73648:37-2748(+)
MACGLCREMVVFSNRHRAPSSLEDPHAKLQEQKAAHGAAQFDVGRARGAARKLMQDINEPLHGEFRIKGVNGIKRYVFLPRNYVAHHRYLKLLREFWGLARPNLLIQTNDNANPSGQLVYQEMIDNVPELQGLKQVTKQDGQDHLITVNSYMRSRLLGTLGNVVVAASTTDSWILSKGYTFSNHRLLQDAINITNANPMVMVVDDPACYIDDWNLHAELAFLALKQLRDGAKPWNVPQPEPVLIDFPAECCVGEENPANSEWKSPTAVPGGMKRYPNWLWTAGECFVFCEDQQDFNDAALGPSGVIMIGGFNKNTGEMLTTAVAEGHPCILINHTGGETMENARLLDGMLQIANAAPGSLKREDLHAHAHALLEQALLGQHTREEPKKQHGCDHLTLAQVLYTIDMHCEIPWLFRERVISVDPLKDSPAQVLDVLSRCFASVNTKTVEIGAGHADREVVLNAWRLHRHLVKNATRDRSRGDAVAVLSVMLTFLASTMAIASNYVEAKRGRWLLELLGPTGKKVIDATVMILPTISTLVSGVMVFGSFSEKWCALHMAAERIVEAIYLFRMRVGNYSLEKDDDEAAVSQQVRAHSARSQFSEVVQGIVSQVVQQDLEHDSLIFTHDAQLLEQHVNETVFGGVRSRQYGWQYTLLADTRKGDSVRAGDAEDPSLSERSDDPLLSGKGSRSPSRPFAEEDDNLSPLGNKAYYEHRVRPMLELYQRRAPRLSALVFLLSTLVLVCASGATVLASFDCNTWIPVAVSASVVFQTLTAHYNLKQRLRGLTLGVARLRALETRWNSLGPLEQRLMGSRKLLTDVCEGTALSIAASQAGDTGVNLHALAHAGVVPPSRSRQARPGVDKGRRGPPTDRQAPYASPAKSSKKAPGTMLDSADITMLRKVAMPA